MSAPEGQFHKKGEHVFNDIAGSVVRALDTSLNPSQAGTRLLTMRYGPLQLSSFPRTQQYVKAFQDDAVLAKARTLAAPPTGEMNDRNSIAYGAAHEALRQVLTDLVVTAADFEWNRKPHSNSSLKHFESVVSSLRKARQLIPAAIAAFDRLIDAAHDPKAEEAILAERTSDSEIARRQLIVKEMKVHHGPLKQRGAALIRAFADELETELQRRIANA